MHAAAAENTPSAWWQPGLPSKVKDDLVVAEPVFLTCLQMATMVATSDLGGGAPRVLRYPEKANVNSGILRYGSRGHFLLTSLAIRVGTHGKDPPLSTWWQEQSSTDAEG
jgi:hypothetical protein